MEKIFQSNCSNNLSSSDPQTSCRVWNHSNCVSGSWSSVDIQIRNNIVQLNRKFLCEYFLYWPLTTIKVIFYYVNLTLSRQWLVPVLTSAARQLPVGLSGSRAANREPKFRTLVLPFSMWVVNMMSTFPVTVVYIIQNRTELYKLVILDWVELYLTFTLRPTGVSRPAAPVGEQSGGLMSTLWTCWVRSATVSCWF